MDLTPRERFIVHLMMVDRFAVVNALAYDHAMNLLNSNATHESKMGNDSCPDCGYELAYGWAEDDWLEDGFSNNAWLGNPISQQEFDTTESKQVDPRIVLSTLRKQRCKSLSDEEAAWLTENVEEEKILSARMLDHCIVSTEANLPVLDFAELEQYYGMTTQQDEDKHCTVCKKPFASHSWDQQKACAKSMFSIQSAKNEFR